MDDYLVIGAGLVGLTTARVSSTPEFTTRWDRRRPSSAARAGSRLSSSASVTASHTRWSARSSSPPTRPRRHGSAVWSAARSRTGSSSNGSAPAASPSSNRTCRGWMPCSHPPRASSTTAASPRPCAMISRPRIGDFNAGETKTDSRDEAIIAQAGGTLPHALRSIQLADESVPELSILCTFDDDVLGQMTAISNRIRGRLTQIHPALERVIGPHLGHPAMLDLLQHDPSPAAMKTAGTTRIATQLLKLPPWMSQCLAGEITQVLHE